MTNRFSPVRLFTDKRIGEGDICGTVCIVATDLSRKTVSSVTCHSLLFGMDKFISRKIFSLSKCMVNTIRNARLLWVSMHRKKDDSCWTLAIPLLFPTFFQYRTYNRKCTEMAQLLMSLLHLGFLEDVGYHRPQLIQVCYLRLCKICAIQLPVVCIVFCATFAMLLFYTAVIRSNDGTVSEIVIVGWSLTA